jgi:tetratricopeptide (TPR) repeat protein
MRTLLLVLILSAAIPARADEVNEQAKEHFAKGQTHYALGEFEQAADEFKEAFRLRKVPIILYNIAQALRLSGNLQNAIFFYSQYLTRQPDAANRAEVEARIAELRTQLQRETGRPPNDLAPEKVEAAAPPPAVAKPAAKPTTRAAVPVAAVAASPPAASIKPTRLAGYVALGAGALLEGGAYLFHASASSAADELSRKYNAGTLTPADAHLRSDIDSKGRLATMSAIGGALLLASGAVLVFAF